MRTWRQHARGYQACVAFLLCCLAVALGACSTTNLGGSGAGFSGLGTQNLAPAGTPSLQGTVLGGTYAFVYGDQVWLKGAQDKAPRQLTHLALSATVTYRWGPVVWSSDGGHIAFALGQDQASGPSSGYGALYIVDTSNGDTQLTAGTSSVYGHTYAWYGANALFYANGTGIQFYDFSNPSDPRPFTAVTVGNGPDYSASGTAHYITFSDIAFLGQHLFATRIDVASFGGAGTVGTAGVMEYFVPTSATNYSGGSMGITRYGLSGYQVEDLGRAYTNAHGIVATGAWSIARTGGIVFDQITGVDAQAGTVKSTVCYGYSIGGCDNTLFQDVNSFPGDMRPQFAFTSDGKTIAFGGPAVSIEQRSGSGFTKLTAGAVGQPPQWSPDDSSLTATQASTPTSGANVMIYAGGKLSVLIAGAQGLSWSPQS